MSQKEFFTLDFDTIKNDIKNYIKNNSSQLKDYNYEGSAITELINVLAYVTQYQSFYLNMVANELFISTAQMKENVYKLSTMLGYVPYRATAPYIQITLLNESTSTITVPKHSKFQFGDASCYIRENVIVPMMSVTVTPCGATLTTAGSSTVIIYEGTVSTRSFVVPERNTEGYYITTSTNTGFDFTSPLQSYLKFNLPDKDYEYIDNNYMQVIDVVNDEWTQVNQENPKFGEKFYYLQFLDKFTIMFDNGGFFKAPEANTKMTILYAKTSGTLFNNTKGELKWHPNETFAATSSFRFSININDLMTGGTAPESLENIRNHAPLFYVTNNRAVTEDDYNIVLQKYPAFSEFVDGVIWGGEKEYVDSSYNIQGMSLTLSLYKDVGHIYVSCLKPSSNRARRIYDYEYLNATEYNALTTYLSRYKILTLFFKRHDPNILYFRPIADIKFRNIFVDINVIGACINEYFYDTYAGYNKTLNKSNLTQYLDTMPEVEYSDISYTTELKILNNYTTVVDNTSHKCFRLNNVVVPGSILSYLIKTETLLGTTTTPTYSIYNDAFIYVGSTIVGRIMDNNTLVNAQQLGNAGLYLSVCLTATGTLNAQSTFSVYYDSSPYVTIATVASIYKLYDNQISATYGAIIVNTTTVGYVHYNDGFGTISSSLSALLKLYKTYTFRIDFESQIHQEFNKDTFLSPKIITINIL